MTVSTWEQYYCISTLHINIDKGGRGAFFCVFDFLPHYYVHDCSHKWQQCWPCWPWARAPLLVQNIIDDLPLLWLSCTILRASTSLFWPGNTILATSEFVMDSKDPIFESLPNMETTGIFTINKMGRIKTHFQCQTNMT